MYEKEEYPDSYKHNSPKEELVLSYAENFRRQYVHLYRDRKPLLLNPVNECGIEVSDYRNSGWGLEVSGYRDSGCSRGQ